MCRCNIWTYWLVWHGTFTSRRRSLRRTLCFFFSISLARSLSPMDRSLSCRKCGAQLLTTYTPSQHTFQSRFLSHAHATLLSLLIKPQSLASYLLARKAYRYRDMVSVECLSDHVCIQPRLGGGGRRWRHFVGAGLPKNHILAGYEPPAPNLTLSDPSKWDAASLILLSPHQTQSQPNFHPYRNCPKAPRKSLVIIATTATLSHWITPLVGGSVCSALTPQRSSKNNPMRHNRVTLWQLSARVLFTVCLL